MKVGEDKKMRSEIHTAIRQQYSGLDSSTGSKDGQKCITVVYKPQRTKGIFLLFVFKLLLGCLYPVMHFRLDTSVSQCITANIACIVCNLSTMLAMCQNMIYVHLFLLIKLKISHLECSDSGHPRCLRHNVWCQPLHRWGMT